MKNDILMKKNKNIYSYIVILYYTAIVKYT